MHATIACIKQVISLPNPMIPFEIMHNNEIVSYSALPNIVIKKMIMINDTHSAIDFSGKWVKEYANIVNICDEAQFGLHSFIIGCNKMNRTCKH